MAARKEKSNAGRHRYRGFLAVSAVFGVVAFLFGHPFIDDNQEATNVIVTVFSVFAGFLIAVMSLLGDQSMLPGTWRIAEVKRRAIKNALIRQKWLFHLYLATLAVIFVAALLRGPLPAVTDVLERVYFGLATTAFMLSFHLPSSLMGVQMNRVDAVIEARRKAASTLDRS